MRNVSKCFLVAFLASILTMLPSLIVWLEEKAWGAELTASPLTQTLNAPPDNSLTVQEYYNQGLPKLDISWSSGQYQRALGVLEKLASEDFTRLPRNNSQKSGAVFEKLLLVRGLASDNPIEVYPDSALTLGRVSSLAKIYLNAAVSKNFWFGIEFARICRLSLKSYSELLEEVRGIMESMDKRDPTYATRLAGLQQVKLGVYLQLDGILTILDDLNLNLDERNELMSGLEEFGPNLIAFLSAEHRDALKQHIMQLTKTVRSEDKVVLNKLASE